MDWDNLVTIILGICFCMFIGTVASCTYKAGVDYNQCVINAPTQNAQYCKVTR